MNEKFGALAPTILDTFDTALYKFFISFNKFERHWKTLAKSMSLIISLSEPTVPRATNDRKGKIYCVTQIHKHRRRS